jgi:hypothetical protein
VVDHLIGASASEATVHGPLEVVNGTPLYVATQLASVLRSGATASQIFFFLIALGLLSGSPSKPAKSTRSPGGAPSGGVTICTTLTPSFSEEAHNTIAFDSTPFIVAGLRLQMTTTRAPFNCSSGIRPARPETTVRGAPSPQSI